MNYRREVEAYLRGYEQGTQDTEKLMQEQLRSMVDDAKIKEYREGYDDALESVRRFVDEQ